MTHIRRHPNVDRWQVRYKDPLGKERSKNFKRKADAEAFSATVTADVLRGDYLDPTAGRTTFAHYVEVWESTRTGLARSSRDRDHSYLQSMILPTFARRSVALIKTSDVMKWLAVVDFLGFVFVAARGGPLRYDNWRTRIWSRIVTEANVGSVSETSCPRWVCAHMTSHHTGM